MHQTTQRGLPFPNPSRNRRSGPAVRVLLVFAVAVSTLTACGPSDPVEHVRELQRQGRFEESIEPLRELIREQPDSAELAFLYGTALIQTSQHSLAHWPLRRAMEDPKWLVRAGLPLAASLTALGNHEAAIEVLDQVLAKEPDNVEALLLRSRARIQTRQDYEGGLADAERVRELDPENPGFLVPRAAALLGLKRLDETAEALAELEERFRTEELGAGQMAHFCLTRATFAKEKGDLELATERFEKCLEDMPRDDSVVRAVVEFYEEQGRPDRSMEILRDTLAAAPEANLYRNALAERLELEGKVDEAEQLLIEGTQLEDLPPAQAVVAWTDLSRHYQRQDEADKAVAAFDHVIELSPDPLPGMFFEYAEVLLLDGRYDRALEVADRIEVPPMRDFIRGRVLLERKKPKEALARFEAGLALWPDNSVAHYLAARAAEQIGDFDRAIGEYRYAIRVDPSATDARLRLAQIRLAEGDLQTARIIAVQATGKAEPDWEAELAALRGVVASGNLQVALELLPRLSREPKVAGRALAAIGRGVGRRDGPAAGAAFIEKARGLDLTNPIFDDALEALIELQLEAGDVGDARARVDAALAAHPEEAAFHAIRGELLERSGAPAAEVQAAYARAVALATDEARAQAGLARLAVSRNDAATAVDAYRRAAEADAAEPSYRKEAARLLASLGRTDEARSELETLLREHPTDVEAALQLGDLLLESAQSDDWEEALALGKRARRFRGAGRAEALVAAAQGKLGHT